MINELLGMTGKKIIVTGASSGIGREASILLSKLGVEVALLGRNEKQLQDTLQLLEGKGHQYYVFDFILDIENVSFFMKKLVDSHGEFDGLVHCAGVQITKAVKLTTIHEFEEIYRINTTSAFALAKGFIQKGVFSKNASIVFISSSSAIRGEAGLSAYSSSKGALMTLTRSLAAEFVRLQVRVNCIVSGFVKTPLSQDFFAILSEQQIKKIESLYPLGLGEPKDVANSIIFLLSNLSRWMTGNALVLDGGSIECSS